MAKLLQYGGWLLASVMLILCAILTSQLWRVQAALKDARTLVATQHDELTTRTATPEIETLESKINDLERALQEARADKDRTAMAAPAPQTPAPTTPPEELMKVDAAEKKADEAHVQRDRIVKAQRQLVADMVYKDLFQELDLAPDLTAQLKDAIAVSMGNQQELAQSAMRSKDRTAKTVRAERDAVRAALREQLDDLLTPQELAAFDDYELVADQILLEKTVDGQLGALASGLTPENRLLTSQVMAEELVREFDLFDETDEIYSIDNFNQAQARGLQGTLDRLSGTLSEEQLGQVQGFVDQALAMFDAMSDSGGA